MRSADLSQRFQEVLAGYLEAKERGERVDAEALLRAHPELAAELKEYFANEKQLASMAGFAAAPRSGPIGQRVGDYEILGEIARGGMGVVYRARHRTLGRLVALKMMLAGEFAGREGLRRFNEEARVVADLDHPNIVPIYDHDLHDGQAYYAMKLIEGKSLKEEIAGYIDKPEEAARLIIRVARAVHYAHQRGVLHRDLKPGNVLLQMTDPRSQTEKKNKAAKKKQYPISGVPQSALASLQYAIPYVTDFGLAKRFRADGKASHSTAVVGTAAYMAPEQAVSKEALTVAADVYSLGAILYEMLTGSKPFTGDNAMEVLLKVVNDEPPSLLIARPTLDPDLAHICLKCLRKNPEERYASAEALAEELEHWLEGETLSVRAPTLPERSARWCRRHPLASGMIGMIVFAVFSLSGLGGYLAHLDQQLQDEKIASALDLAESERNARIAAEKAKADIEEATARAQIALDGKEKADAARMLALEANAKSHAAEVAALKESRRLLVQHYVNSGEQILQRGDAFGSAVWFAKALEREPSEPMHAVRLGTIMRQCPPLEQIWFLDGKARLLRLSPAGDRILIGVKSDEAALYDAKSGRQLGGAIRHDGDISAAEFSPDGLWLATAGKDGSARLWDAASAAPHGNPLKHPLPIHALAFSADGSRLATGSADKSARVWIVATAKPAGPPFELPQQVRLVAFHPDGKKLLTVCENSKSTKAEMRVWDLATHRGYFDPWPDPKAKDVKGILDAGFSRDGRRLFAVTSTRRIHLWDSAGKPVATPTSLSVKGESGGWFSPTLDRCLSAGENEIKLIDLPGGGVAHTLRGDGPIESAQFSPGGVFVATTSANGGMRLFRANSGAPFCPALPHGAKIAALAFSQNDQSLAVAGDDGIVRLWNLAWPERGKNIALPKNKGTLLTGSPDGRYALLASAKSAQLWDVEQGKPVGSPLPIGGGGSMLFRWSSDGTGVAMAVGGEARAWEVPSGKAFEPSKEIAAWARRLQPKNPQKGTHLLDCDGQRLAVWKTKGALEIEDISGNMAKTLKLPLVPDAFRFSPDRRHAAAGFADGSLRILDLAEGKPATAPFWLGEPIRQLTYSPDGRLLASAGNSGRIRVWDAATGQALSADLFAVGPLVELAFREDAKLLAAWTENRLQRWSLAPLPDGPADLLQRARLTAGQEIDADRGVLVPLDAAALKARWKK